MIGPFRPLRLFVMAFAASIVFIPAGALAQAKLVSGPVSGIWTYLSNPIIATGECRVPAGLTLIVRPGVQFLLAPGASLVVDGTLSVWGSLAYPVSVGASDQATGPWRSIVVSPIGQASFIHTVIRGGGAALPGELSGMLHTDGASASASRLSLVSCEISGSATSGVFLNGGSVTANGCRFYGNGGANPTDAAIHVVTGAVLLGKGDDFNSIENGVFGLYNQDIVPVDATGQWWGSSVGPQQADNVAGIGSSVSDDVVFGGWVLLDPLPGMGDLDMDGAVTVGDVSILLKVIAGIDQLPPGLAPLADVVRDGSLNLIDVTRLARAASGLAPL